MLVKALRCTRTYREVAMDLTERKRGESQAFRLKNFVDVARTLGSLCALPVGARRAAASRGPRAND